MGIKIGNIGFKEKNSNLFAGIGIFRIAKDQEGLLINPSGARLSAFLGVDIDDKDTREKTSLNYGKLGVMNDDGSIKLHNFNDTAKKENKRALIEDKLSGNKAEFVVDGYGHPVTTEDFTAEVATIRFCVESLEEVKSAEKGVPKSEIVKSILTFKFITNGISAFPSYDNEKQAYYPGVKYINKLGNNFYIKAEEGHDFTVFTNGFNDNVKEHKEYIEGHTYPVFADYSNQTFGFTDLIDFFKTLVRADYRVNMKEVESTEIIEPGFYEILKDGSGEDITQIITEIINDIDIYIKDKVKTNGYKTPGVGDLAFQLMMAAREDNGKVSQKVFCICRGFESDKVNDSSASVIRQHKARYKKPRNGKIVNHVNERFHFGLDNNTISFGITKLKEEDILKYFENFDKATVANNMPLTTDERSNVVNDMMPDRSAFSQPEGGFEQGSSVSFT